MPGSRVGAYLSPHVRGWSERIRVDGAEADFEARRRARARRTRQGATQFEVVTAAALLAFADGGGRRRRRRGGSRRPPRRDERPAHARRRAHERRARAHGRPRRHARGDRRREARRRAARLHRRARRRRSGKRSRARTAPHAVVVAGSSNLALADGGGGGVPRRRGRPARRGRRSRSRAGSRRGARSRSRSGTAPTTSPGSATSCRACRRREYVLVCSILADKRPELMLEALSVLGPTLIATESSNPRALRAGDLAARAEPYFQHVEPIPDPFQARRRALELAGPRGAVAVTGSLYLLC